MFERIFSGEKVKREKLFSEEKIFCIGLNKTGTTSLEKALVQLGYRMGDQYSGEMLSPEYAKRNFKPLLELCLTANAFQDAPFSFPYTYVILDHYFPNAKFILTVRDSTDQWYDSMVKFHSKKYGRGNIPTEEDLKNAVYRYKGKPWETNRILFNTPDGDPYHKPTLSRYYENHNYNVREYFRMKSNFIEVNISGKGDYQRLCSFLGKQPKGDDFPWENKTANHKIKEA
jgi:hypothetical protein